MQTSDLVHLGILALFFLGVLYVAAKAKTVQRHARAAELSAQEVAKTSQSVDDMIKGTVPVARQQSDQRLAILYQVAADHYISGNEILWAYLYYYFVGATFLALAWTTVFAVQNPDGGISRDVVLGTLAFGGVALSAIWRCLLRRSDSYRHPVRNAASQAEKALRDAIDPEGTFTQTQRHGEILGWGLGSTRFVINAVPLLLGGVFVVFLLVVLWPYICG